MSSERRKFDWEGFVFGELTAAMVAFSLYMPNQVVSVASKHIAVALDIPEKNTGIYFSKLRSAMYLVSLGCSCIMYMVKWIVSENNMFLTLGTYFFIWLSRLFLFIVMFRSENVALSLYGCMVFSSFSMGLFQMTFYSLTVDHTTAISLAFRVSKFLIWGIQLLMDVLFPSKPLLMVRIQFFLVLLAATLSFLLWVYFCIKRISNYLVVEDKQDKETLVIRKWRGICLGSKYKKVSLAEYQEPSIGRHIINALSPLLMCVIPQAIKCFLWPGLLPYSILKRERCHIINMLVTPVSIMGTFAIHCLKLRVSSIRQRWAWYWHLFWLFVIPEVAVFFCTLVALHFPDTQLSRSIIDSVPAASILVFALYTCYPILDSLGYLGVTANVKHNGETLNNGLKVVTTNQLLYLFVNVISYKMSVGYSITRNSFFGSTPCYIPTEGMTSLSAIWFWISSTVSNGYRDFIEEFNFNIREYV